MTAAELRRRRCAAQLLVGADGPHSTAAVVAHLLAVQAQDLRAARLALLARRATRLDAALTEDRSVVITWLMRGTLHLVAREDYGWLHALTAGQAATTIRRRLSELGVAPDAAERAVAQIERALADGPLLRSQLGERLAVKGQALAHLLGLAASRGTIVRGPADPAHKRHIDAYVQGGEQAFVLARDWLGPAEPVPDRAVALAELARRYLRAHGPASAADLAAWSRLGLRDARAGLAAIAGRLAQVGGDLVDLADRPAPPTRVPPRLLPAFDPYLLGWRDRGFAVAPEHARRVHPGGGIVRATAIANGRAVATWSLRGGTVTIDPFAPLTPSVAAALAREANRLTNPG